MKNREIAKIFFEISEMLAMDDIPFKPQAYEKAAVVVEGMEKDMEDIYRREGNKGLEDIPGIGKSMAEKIAEYLESGRIKEYEKMKKKFPVDIAALTAVEGLGPKKIKFLYEKLKIKDLAGLEKAARDGKLKNLEGFGEKTEKNILQGLEFVQRDKGRYLLGNILPLAEKIKEKLLGAGGAGEAEFGGSLRRMKETIGDVDILATAENPEKVMDYFTALPGVEKIWGKGTTKSSVRLDSGFDVDLRVVEKNDWGSALQYFTGSKSHNIKIREIAQKKGMKLNEYGLFKGKKKIAGKTEKEVYKALGLDYIEPEMREDRGEIELAREGRLPDLINYDDILGDLHLHSEWSDGGQSILEMAKAAQELGHKYILMTDHAGHLKIANGMDEERLLKYMDEIDKVSKKINGIKVLKGAEVDIRKDGALTIKDEILAKLDIVLIAIHDNFKMARADMTARICRAMSNPYAGIFTHPTGRILLRREGYQLDMEKIIKTAVKTKTALEINTFPDRLDLNDENARRAAEAGAKLAIGTDSHDKSQLNFYKLGVAVARRGWAEKKDILNTKSAADLVKYFRR